MKKIRQYDLYGNFVREYNTVSEAKAEHPEAKNIFRCLFGECGQTGKSFWVFEDDDRILPNGKLDIFDGVIQYDVSELVELGRYNTLEECPNPIHAKAAFKNQMVKRFDNIPKEIEVRKSDGTYVGVFPDAATAREKTGAKTVWGCIFGECKNSNGYSFRFAPEIPF